MKEFHRSLFFTKAPLGGHYSYKDIFQIFPCALENMPVYKAQKHHPNILEFWTTDEEVVKSPIEFEGQQELLDKTVTQIIKQDRILALLTTFTNNLFFRYTDISGAWGIPILIDDLGNETNTWSSKWCVNMYYFQDLPRQFKIDKFTDQKIPEIKRIPHRAFYTNEPDLDSNPQKEIVFPASIDQLFEAYYSLEPTIAFCIDSACYYTVSAIELLDTRKTLSLLSSFTSMETMVNLENKNVEAENCEACGQLRYSVARKFREYLLKYIGDTPSNKKKFNSYYSTRSKIVHTGRQLKTELLFADVAEDEKHSELETRIGILQLGKLAITNWLLLNGKF